MAGTFKIHSHFRWRRRLTKKTKQTHIDKRRRGDAKNTQAENQNLKVHEDGALRLHSPSAVQWKHNVATKTTASCESEGIERRVRDPVQGPPTLQFLSVHSTALFRARAGSVSACRQSLRKDQSDQCTWVCLARSEPQGSRRTFPMCDATKIHFSQECFNHSHSETEQTQRESRILQGATGGRKLRNEPKETSFDIFEWPCNLASSLRKENIRT